MDIKLNKEYTLNNNLVSRPDWIIDPETGKITGYKTPGGADTVFPFSNIKYKKGQYSLLSSSGTYAVTVEGEIIGVVTLATTGASPTGNAWFKDAGYNVSRLSAIRSVAGSTVTFGTWTSGLTFEYCICYK